MSKSTFFCLAILFGAMIFAPTLCCAKDKFVVVLDAGHGGGDPGTTHRKGKKDEKQIVLDVTLRLGKMIEANHKDVKVVYTRTTDVYPTLPERTQIAKKAQGDLFISVHVNAAPDRNAHGVETYIFGVTGLKGKSADEQKRIRERMANERENLDIDGKQVDFDRDMDIETKILCQAQREKNNIHSEEAAKMIHRAIISGLKRTSYKASVHDRGVKEKNIFVLCYSPMPAVLVELGYLSNTDEEKFLNSDEAVTTFTKAIYDGFVKYKTSWDKRKLNSATPAPEPEPTPAPTLAPTLAPTPAQPVDNVDNVENVDNVDNIENIDKNEKNPPAAAPVPQEIFFKIQFLSSARLLQDGAPEFKGLKPVSHYMDGKVYRYTFGKASSTAELQADLKRIKKLFSDAFIIKTDEKGNRIK